jgi:hypothetical protein
MTPSELTSRVGTVTGLLVLPAAAVAWLAGGAPALLGVFAGGVLAVLNFRWLASSARSALEGPRPMWLPRTALRFGALAAGAAALLASGWTHPVGVVAGLAVLPCAVIAAGLSGHRATRS